jgi:hypothetical protein
VNGSKGEKQDKDATMAWAKSLKPWAVRWKGKSTRILQVVSTLHSEKRFFLGFVALPLRRTT